MTVISCKVFAIIKLNPVHVHVLKVTEMPVVTTHKGLWVADFGHRGQKGGQRVRDFVCHINQWQMNNTRAQPMLQARAV